MQSKKIAWIFASTVLSPQNIQHCCRRSSIHRPFTAQSVHQLVCQLHVRFIIDPSLILNVYKYCTKPEAVILDRVGTLRDLDMIDPDTKQQGHTISLIENPQGTAFASRVLMLTPWHRNLAKFLFLANYRLPYSQPTGIWQTHS